MYVFVSPPRGSHHIIVYTATVILLIVYALDISEDLMTKEDA